MANHIHLKINENNNTNNYKKVSFNLEQNETFYFKKYLDKQRNTIIDTYNSIYNITSNNQQNNNNRENNNYNSLRPFISNTNYNKHNQVFKMHLFPTNTNYKNINKNSIPYFTMSFIK